MAYTPGWLGDGLSCFLNEIDPEHWGHRLERHTNSFRFLRNKGHDCDHQMEEPDKRTVIHHFDYGPEKVWCLIKRGNHYFEGGHHRGHCPGLIYPGINFPSKEDEEMAKSPKKAGLNPQKHVAEEKKAPKEKPKPRPCACGCGQMTGGGTFCTAHDSKLKSRMLKMRRGELKVKDLNSNEKKMWAVAEKKPDLKPKELAAAAGLA